MKELKGFAITSMVIGIISLLLTLCWCGFYYYAMLPLAVIGLVLGIISLAKHRAGFYRAVAGVIMCSITVILSILFIIFIVIKYDGKEYLIENVIEGMLVAFDYGDVYTGWYFYLAFGLPVVGFVIMMIIFFIRRKKKK